MLLLIVAVVGSACAECIISSLLDATSAAVAPSRQLRRQIVGTAAFVFVTFLLRAVFSTMNALANALQNDAAGCANPCDPSCYNVWSLMSYWLQFTPEFQLSVELISSPLALLVALWGMTSKHTLRLMQSRRREMNVMRVGVLQETLPPPSPSLL